MHGKKKQTSVHENIYFNDPNKPEQTVDPDQTVHGSILFVHPQIQILEVIKATILGVLIFRFFMVIN